MRAVVLAGGPGVRLQPLTATVPKVLARVGGEHPILDIVLGQLARAGARRVTLALHHLADAVVAFCGDGSRWGLELDFAVEDAPLGTVGPLAQLRDLPDDFLVVNGDVLTELDHRAFFAAHLAAGNDVTLAVCRRATQVPYGVVEYDPRERRVRRLVEKPTWSYDVSMGVYAVRRRALARLEPGRPCGFDRFVDEALAGGDRVGVVPFDGFWLDVGTPEDHARADARWAEVRGRLGR